MWERFERTIELGIALSSLVFIFLYKTQLGMVWVLQAMVLVLLILGGGWLIGFFLFLYYYRLGVRISLIWPVIVYALLLSQWEYHRRIRKSRSTKET